MRFSISAAKTDMLRRFCITLVTSILFCVIFPTAAAWGYTPDDDVVREMVDRGVRFLESGNQELKYREGSLVLKAYAHHKVMHDSSHPVAQNGIRQAIAFAEQYANLPNNASDIRAVYRTAISILLLADVDPFAHKEPIRLLENYLTRLQQNNGAFGYHGRRTGDVSQVQYAMLAYWTLQHIDSEVDPDRIGDCLAWLLRVQDPSGAWPYQGNDPGPNSNLVPQSDEVGMSMALAGGSAALIGADILGYWGSHAEIAKSLYPDMPKAIKILKEQKERNRPKNLSDSQRKQALQAISLCQKYRARNPFKQEHWFYYQLYTLERYCSFADIAQGESEDSRAGPKWYNQGVDMLRDLQSVDGDWGREDQQTGTEISTAFAILFLIRSTQTAIASASTGTLAGGQGLPTDTTDIKISGTKISGRSVAAAVGDMLDLLEDDGGDLEGKSIPDDLQLAADPKERRAQLDRLERLVRGSRSWQARRVAARLLGKSEEMRVVPALIFALSDPDKSVRRYARDGLRFISRKFDGYGLADDPTEGEVKGVQEKWRQWYLRVNPKHVFLE